jgi:elongation factor Ts
MAISASDVKELRTRSGAGMLDCKNALVETNGNIEEAINYLRKKGIGKASKKVDRLASEGLIAVVISDDKKTASMCEINSETDFVAKNDAFISLVNNITKHVIDNNFQNNDELNKSTIDGALFSEFVANKTATIGEKIVMRRFEKISANDEEILNGYIHSNGKIGVLLLAKYEGSDADKARELLKNISMHAAAMAPMCLDPKEVPSNFINKELDIAKEDLKKQNKPEAIWDKILGGKEAKLKQENSLLGQSYVMDNKLTIKKALEEFSIENGKLNLISYTRFELGEGLEKKVENFAQEVAEQLG